MLQPKEWRIRTLLVAALPIVVLSWHSAGASQSTDRRTIEVVATRFAFAPANIEVTAGEPIRLLVKSGDGLHGFQIKELNIAKDVPRGGDAVVIEFTASAAGRYAILCSTYCGDGHNDMKGTLTVTARASVP